jgi:hypothetical protein
MEIDTENRQAASSIERMQLNRQLSFQTNTQTPTNQEYNDGPSPLKPVIEIVRNDNDESNMRIINVRAPVPRH